MSTLRHALITPSYRGDYERCRLLLESVARWVPEEIPHYLVIERRDLAMFRPFESGRTQILVVEDVVSLWLRRLPGVARFWFGVRTLPVRNWIMQQLVKLSVANHVGEDVMLFVDSDVFFVAPFDPRTEERDGRVPFYVQNGQRGILSFNDRWHAVAARLIGLPVEESYDTNFVGQVMHWRRDHALSLQQRIASVRGRRWDLAVASQWVISEYIIYGLYITRVLGIEAAGHYPVHVDRTCCYWDPVPLDEAGLLKLKASIQPSQHSVMISAKSYTPIDTIRKVFT